jgi:hypothetical protein
MRPLLYVLLLAGTAGCNLYFTSSPDAAAPDPCGGGGGGGGGAGSPTRDPTTGACTLQSGPNCVCGVCSGPTQVGANCFGPCQNLDEADCLAMPTCHAAYFQEVGGGSQGSTFAFDSCWDTFPLTPNPPLTGTCFTEDALTCSLRDDCASVMSSTGGIQFASCAPVPTAVNACATKLCNKGSECNVSCDATGSCVPTCVAKTNALTCDQSQVTCAALPPSCPVDTNPGVSNSCWTGNCVPANECLASCPTFTTQSECASHQCSSVLKQTVGDCVCPATGACNCTGTFQYCE